MCNENIGVEDSLLEDAHKVVVEGVDAKSVSDSFSVFSGLCHNLPVSPSLSQSPCQFLTFSASLFQSLPVVSANNPGPLIRRLACSQRYVKRPSVGVLFCCGANCRRTGAFRAQNYAHEIKKDIGLPMDTRYAFKISKRALHANEWAPVAISRASNLV